MTGHKASDTTPEPCPSLWVQKVSSWKTEEHNFRMSEKKILDFQASSKSLHFIFHKPYFSNLKSHSYSGITTQNGLTKSASMNSIQFFLGNPCTCWCIPVNWIAGHIHPQCNGMACFHHDLERVSPTMNGNMMCGHTPCSPPTGTHNSHRSPVESHALPATHGPHFVVLVLNSTWPATMCENNNCTHETLSASVVSVSHTAPSVVFTFLYLKCC